MYVLMLCVFIALSAQILPAQDIQSESQKVYFIPIQGEIDRSLVVFLRRSIDRAKEEGAQFIIFDINTFGGRVDSALQISTLIGAAEPAETIAFVTSGPESTGVSWSAGALISFACSRIYMSPGTSMGAAAPVTMGSEGPVAASEKVVSAVRAQMAALAEKNGYPVAVAKAMVDLDIELREVYVDDEVIAVTAAELGEVKRKAQREGKTFEEGMVVSPVGKLLTLTAKEMERYSVSSGTVSNQDQLIKVLNVPEAETVFLRESPADSAVGFITSAGFTTVLIIIGLVSLFIEITSPGFGVPGTIAIICFAVVFASYALLGTVGSIELILFVLGLILLILEIFIIPGFGVAGVLGIVLIVASLVLSMQGFVVPSFEWEKNLFRRNLAVVGVGVVSSFITFSILAYFLPHIRLFSGLTLGTTQTADTGFTVQTQEESSLLLGKQGVTVTVLRPSGKAEIEGELVNVETEGEYVESGKMVEVIEVSGNRVVVRKA
jgi:membrane-bound serine protease (ClpP class)